MSNIFLIINEANIVLIPKVESPSKLNDLRPINVCNTMYKIISKILANRIKLLLPSIISSNQSAFVKDMNIGEKSMEAQELLYTMKTKRRKHGLMCLKLDMEKAYDRLEWALIRTILINFNFPDQFIN